MQKIRLLLLFMIFAGSMLAQDTTYVTVYGTVYNLGGNTAIVDVLLNDGQSASVLTSGNGYYYAEFTPNGIASSATSTIINCDGDIESNTGQFGFFSTLQLDLNYCGDVVQGGCMDTAANNYDENATYDDGSCDYCDNTDAVLYVCTFSNGADVGIQILGDGEVVFEQYGFNDVEIAYIPICLEDDVCYEVNMSNSQATGWYGGYYWVQVNGVEIANEFLDDNLSAEMDNFSVNGDACPTEGCTDPDALNYDSEAEIDDGSCIIPEECDDTFVVIEIETAMWPEEMSWYITSSDSSSSTIYGQLYDEANSTFYDYACMEDGCYQLHMFDGFGDGWNGGNITITVDGVEIAYGELISGNYGQVNFGINTDCEEAIGGCTDPSAENYNSEATYEDGSCTYDNGCNCTQDYDPVCALTYDIFTGDSILYTFTNACWAECSNALVLYEGPCDPVDVYGCTDAAALNYNFLATIDDGSCVYAEDCDDNLVVFTMSTGPWGGEIGWTIGPDSTYFGGYLDNSVAIHTLCLEDGCYDIYMMDSFGDGWNGAVLTIEVNGVIHTTTLANGYGGAFTFGINTDDCLPADVYGCTDPLALNYNFLATIDDGSCYYDNGGDSTLCESYFFLVPDSLENTIWAINASTGVNLEYLWDFGDGATSTDPYPMHTYQEDGPFELCLTVSSVSAGGNLCEDTYCETVGAFMFPGLVGDEVGAAQSVGFTLNIVENIVDSVEDLENVQNVQVYPNPANNEVSISLDANRTEILQITLYSINGQQISSNQWTITSGNSNKQFDLEGLESGIYMISITGEQTQLQERIIKL